MRLVVDVNLAPAWIPFLIAAGHDVIHWVGPGHAGPTPQRGTPRQPRATPWVAAPHTDPSPERAAYPRHQHPSTPPAQPRS